MSWIDRFGIFWSFPNTQFPWLEKNVCNLNITTKLFVPESSRTVTSLILHLSRAILGSFMNFLTGHCLNQHICLFPSFSLLFVDWAPEFEAQERLLLCRYWISRNGWQNFVHCMAISFLLHTVLDLLWGHERFACGLCEMLQSKHTHNKNAEHAHRRLTTREMQSDQDTQRTIAQWNQTVFTFTVRNFEWLCERECGWNARFSDRTHCRWLFCMLMFFFRRALLYHSDITNMCVELRIV